MKDNLGLMMTVFGLTIIWWIAFALLMHGTIFLVVGLMFIWAMMIVWGLRPRGESKKWDNFRNKVVLITLIPVYLTAYKDFVGE